MPSAKREEIKQGRGEKVSERWSQCCNFGLEQLGKVTFSYVGIWEGVFQEVQRPWGRSVPGTLENKLGDK